MQGAKDSLDSNIFPNFLLPRQYGITRRLSSPMRAAIFSQVPSTLREREFDPCRVMRSDKIFASAWLDSTRVVTGSKCNKLKIWDVTRGVDEATVPLPPSSQPFPDDACGIHGIALNASRTLLACGSSNPLDIALMDTTTFTDQLVLVGHRDWVFAMAFLDEDRLVSAGRDSCVMLWSARPRSPGEKQRAPLLQRRAHTRKVRDVKLLPQRPAFVTISADNTLNVWSSDSLGVIGKLSLGNQLEEVVCVAADELHGLVAVGTRDGVLLVDIRRLEVVGRLGSREFNGIRSVVCKDHMLSAGSGCGRISFTDLRYPQREFIRDAERKAGPGIIQRNYNYHANFAGQTVRQAIYTHNWSADGSVLFAAGGPLVVGLQGSYAALWS